MCCNEENRFIFMTIRDFFLHYWKNNDTMVDYLMVDYMIVLAQKYDARIKKEFQKIQSNNPECDELYKVMSEPFNQKKWDIMKSETALFKLSWKYQYPIEKMGKKHFMGC